MQYLNNNNPPPPPHFHKKIKKGKNYEIKRSRSRITIDHLKPKCLCTKSDVLVGFWEGGLTYKSRCSTPVFCLLINSECSTNSPILFVVNL